MNTFLSSSQQKLKEQYHAFAKEHVEPIAKKLEEPENHLLKELLQKLGQSGLLGITAPKEYGGRGESFLNLCLLVESLSEFEPGLGLTLAEHTACIELLNKFGNTTQKSRYLPLLARGDAIGTVALSEVTAGTDYQAVQSRVVENGKAAERSIARSNAERSVDTAEEARDEADGAAIKTNGKAAERSAALNFYLSGTKTWVVSGQLASLFIVLARYAEKLSLWLVDIQSAPSLRVSANREKLGLRSSVTNDVEFIQHKLTIDALLGGEQALDAAKAEEQALFAMDVSKVIIAASSVGLIKGALSNAVEYAKTREQFGSPLSQFQAVQWKIADLSTEISAAELMVYRAACSKDESANDFHRLAAMAKLFATKAARVHSGEALQIMGSFGLSVEAPMEKLYRDAKVMEICEGTSEFQKMILTKELEI